MSIEEGPELRELIAQTLENNGVLAKVRAELRASVFLALEDQAAFQTKLPFTNQSLRAFLKTSEGSLITCLVREFLEFFNLDFTLSVFDSETFHGKEYNYSGRTQLMNDLKMQYCGEKNVPVIFRLLQNVLKYNSAAQDETIVKSDVSSVTLPQNLIEVDGEPNTDRILNVSVNEDVSVHIRNKQNYYENYGTAEETTSFIMKEDSSQISKGSLSHTLSISEKRSAAAATAKKETEGTSTQQGNLLTSLGNLPPLAGMLNAGGKSSEVQASRNTDEDKHKKTLTGLGIETMENYEDDFQSSVSGSGQEDKSGKRTTPESDTEIEEDIGLDDLLSNISEADDITIDATASNISAVGDYMENIS